MTTIDRLEPFRPEPLHPEARPDGDGCDAHLLRLCLDLQLDALLLTLGAAGVHAGTAMTVTADDVSVTRPVPWRRWLGEDVDLACALAGDALDGGATLPQILGTELDQVVPATTIDTLTALYSSMRERLADLLDRSPEDSGVIDGSGGTWRPRLREALHRCEIRLAELRDYRLAGTPPHGIRLPEEHQYLPGELLG